jgi:hypothetical protein
MNLLLLGGESPRNKEWLREVRAALAQLFDTVAMHEYWATITLFLPNRPGQS